LVLLLLSELDSEPTPVGTARLLTLLLRKARYKKVIAEGPLQQPLPSNLLFAFIVYYTLLE
jgi:hypothetical protein